MTAKYFEILAKAGQAVRRSDEKYALLDDAIASFAQQLESSVASEVKTGLYVGGEFKEGDKRPAADSSYDFVVTATLATGKHSRIVLTANLNISVSSDRSVFEITDLVTNDKVSVQKREDMTGAFESATQLVIDAFERELPGAIQSL